ncbi:pyridine nucleotide-disulfide oxidoreductase AMID-like protein [Macrophomina phaseolina]|uniref:Pyridine nucleotide-disulfide oxidoreductase AMID-like protein n=1 Tax=Macrophomina phaseolina TaxID=35725 RepID=A0ABQ8FYD0_9PEZI|nr:pyridine nucleotide-disulfide oxidoreductase AMID-like protein [Macrophomina phaseolina]
MLELCAIRVDPSRTPQTGVSWGYVASSGTYTRSFLAICNFPPPFDPASPLTTMSPSAIANGARQQPFKILVIGGSYAGLASSLNLLDLCHGKPARFLPDTPAPAKKIPVEITLVDERDGFMHLISTPLAHASDEFTPKAWAKFDDVAALKAPGVRHLHGSVVSVDCEKKTAKISNKAGHEQIEESYDYLIVGSGLKRAWPVVAQSLDKNSYLAEVGNHIKGLKDARQGVVVVGGGAVGIEMAAELKLIYPSLRVTLIHSRDKLLSSEPLPDDFKDRTLAVLHETGVETIMGRRVLETTPATSEDGSPIYKLTLSDGSQVTTGQVVNALSKSIPTSSYLPKAILDEEGYVKVQPSLRFQDLVPNAEFHYAAGDIVKWSGIKRCGAAMHMGQYAAQNIHAHMLKEVPGVEPTWKELSEFPPMIGLAVGKKAVVYDPQEGTSDGEHLMKSYFEQDLGHQICWNYMQLGREFVAVA